MRQGVKRGRRFVGMLVGALLALLIAATPPVKAQGAPGANMRIVADSAPYRLEWTDGKALFTQRAYATENEQRWPLVYLHSDAGPEGYAKHLAWFLGRDAKSFVLLWCYLDDTGHGFWCWLYRYPSNQLTSQHFNGDYTFTPPAGGENPLPAFKLTPPPVYLGPDFVFQDWTRKSGALTKLALTPSASTEGTPPAADAGASVRTLDHLDVHPLHQLKVGGGNGWRTAGWEELHALAYDSKSNPYYLILYSNATRGFVIDLTQGQTYTADFGAKVKFGDMNGGGGFGPNGHPDDKPLIPQVHRNERYEIELKTTHAYTDPYAEVMVDIELRSPDEKVQRVPGYWDGGSTWRFRFAPPRAGTWNWRVFSNDSEMEGKQGQFECIAETDPAHGFKHVYPYRLYQRHFVEGQTTPFYPAFVSEPALYDLPSGVVGAVHTVVDTSASGKDPASFEAFQGRIDGLHAAGFNRLTGGYLLTGGSASEPAPSNEGGAVFLGGDPDRINPAFFQWADKRLAYCNSLNIAPDIGLARLPAEVFASVSDVQLLRLWRYVLARYASYDVCWNLFGATPVTALDQMARFDPFAELTQRYDPFHHPLTTTLTLPMNGILRTRPIGEPRVFKAPDPKPGGPVIFTPGDIKTVPQLLANAPSSFMLPTWIDVVTVANADMANLHTLQPVPKPIVVLGGNLATSAAKPPALVTPSLEDLRIRIWDAHMHVAYWGDGEWPNGLAPESPEARTMAICDHFFRQTRWWRLEMHSELLGKPEETNSERRRRKAAEEEAAKQQAAQMPTPEPPKGNMPQPLPIPVPSGNAQPPQVVPKGDQPAPPIPLKGSQPPPIFPKGAQPPLPTVPKDAQPTPAKPGVAGPMFVLADPSHEYVVYFEHGGVATLDLLEATGHVRVSWLNPRTGETKDGPDIVGGSYRSFIAPDDQDWVLYISRESRVMPR